MDTRARRGIAWWNVSRGATRSHCAGCIKESVSDAFVHPVVERVEKETARVREKET